MALDIMTISNIIKYMESLPEEKSSQRDLKEAVGESRKKISEQLSFLEKRGICKVTSSGTELTRKLDDNDWKKLNKVIRKHQKTQSKSSKNNQEKSDEDLGPIGRAVEKLADNVHNELGQGFTTSYQGDYVDYLKRNPYYQALRIELENSKIPFKSAVKLPIKYQGEKVGEHISDFILKSKSGYIPLKVSNRNSKDKGNYAVNPLKLSLRLLGEKSVGWGLLINFPKSNSKIEVQKINK